MRCVPRQCVVVQ